MYQRRSKEEREQILSEYRKLKAQKVSMIKAAKILNVSKGTLNSWWTEAKNNAPSVIVHEPTTKRSYNKKTTNTPQPISSRAIVIVTTTANIAEVLRQL